MLAVHSEKLLIEDGVGCRAQPPDGTVTDIVYQGESLRVFLELADGTCLSLRQPEPSPGLAPVTSGRRRAHRHPPPRRHHRRAQSRRGRENERPVIPSQHQTNQNKR